MMLSEEEIAQRYTPVKGVPLFEQLDLAIPRYAYTDDENVPARYDESSMDESIARAEWDQRIAVTELSKQVKMPLELQRLAYDMGIDAPLLETKLWRSPQCWPDLHSDEQQVLRLCRKMRAKIATSL